MWKTRKHRQIGVAAMPVRSRAGAVKPRCLGLAPDKPFRDSEVAVGVVCCRTGWWGSPKRPKRARGLARDIAGHHDPAALSGLCMAGGMGALGAYRAGARLPVDALGAVPSHARARWALSKSKAAESSMNPASLSLVTDRDLHGAMATLESVGSYSHTMARRGASKHWRDLRSFERQL